MARKPLSVWEQEQRREYCKLLKSYAPEAVKNIYKIATTSIDARIRLNANIWLADKAFGKDYKVFENEAEENNKTINVRLIPVGEPYIPSEKDAQEIWKAENGIIEEETGEEWDADDWGEEKYSP